MESSRITAREAHLNLIKLATERHPFFNVGGVLRSNHCLNGLYRVAEAALYREDFVQDPDVYILTTEATAKAVSSSSGVFVLLTRDRDSHTVSIGMLWVDVSPADDRLSSGAACLLW